MLLPFLRLVIIGGLSLVAFVFCFPYIADWLLRHYPNRWFSGVNATVLLTAIPTCLLFPTLLLKLWKNNFETLPHFQDMVLQPNDPELIACIEKARSEIHRFETSLQSDATAHHLARYSKNAKDFSFPKLWYEVEKFEADQLYLKPIPTQKDEIHDVSQIVSLDDIDDWCIVAKKGMQGAYTNLALYKAHLQMHGKHPRIFNEQLNAFSDINFKTLSFVSKDNKKQKFFTW